MFRCIAPIYQSRHSETDQKCKSLHQTLDDFLRTGELNAEQRPESFDFKDVEDSSKVDLRANLPHDVDLLDAACNIDNPFFGVVPLSKPSESDVKTPESKPIESNTPSSSDPPTAD